VGYRRLALLVVLACAPACRSGVEDKAAAQPELPAPRTPADAEARLAPRPPPPLPGAAGRVLGRVTSTAGEPLPEFAVEARPEPPGGRAPRRARTDARGAFALELPPDVYVLRVAPAARADGRSFVEPPTDRLVVVAPAEEERVDFTLEEGGALVGFVGDAQGRPVDSAILYAGPVNGLSQPSRELARTDAEGRFEVQGLAPGRLFVLATAAALASGWREIAIEPGVTRALALELAPCTWILPRCVDAQGARLAAELLAEDGAGQRYLPFLDGQARPWFGPFLAGTYRLSARRGTSVSERSLVLSGAEPLYEVELVLE